MKTIGFTLIEILVVILIISIVSAAILLTFSRNTNKEAFYFTQELTQTISLAQEQAMLQPAIIGILFTSNAYQFLKYTKTKWIPLEDKLLNYHAIPETIQVNIQISDKEPAVTLENESDDDQEDATPHPQIIISTSGDLTPFKIYVGAKGKSARYVIAGETDGSIKSQTMPEE